MISYWLKGKQEGISNRGLGKAEVLSINFGQSHGFESAWLPASLLQSE